MFSSFFQCFVFIALVSSISHNNAGSGIYKGINIELKCSKDLFHKLLATA